MAPPLARSPCAEARAPLRRGSEQWAPRVQGPLVRGKPGTALSSSRLVRSKRAKASRARILTPDKDPAPQLPPLHWGNCRAHCTTLQRLSLSRFAGTAPWRPKDSAAARCGQRHRIPVAYIVGTSAYERDIVPLQAVMSAQGCALQPPIIDAMPQYGVSAIV